MSQDRIIVCAQCDALRSELDRAERKLAMAIYALGRHAEQDKLDPLGPHVAAAYLRQIREAE